MRYVPKEKKFSYGHRNHVFAKSNILNALRATEIPNSCIGNLKLRLL